MTLNDLLDKLVDLGVISVTKGPHSSRLIEYPYPWNGNVELRARSGSPFMGVELIEDARRAKVYLHSEKEHEC